MKTTLKQLLTACAVMGLAATSMGCADNGSTMFIRQVAPPDVDDECVSTPDPNGITYSRGLVDVVYGTSAYSENVIVGNQLIPRGDADTLRVETSRVQLYETETTVFDSAGAELAAFTVPTSGFIDPAAGTLPSYGLADATMIDGATLGSVDASGGNVTLVARVKVYGTTLGGTEVETGFWDFPVTVCDGCYGCIPPADVGDDLIPVCRPGRDYITPDCRIQP